MKKMPGDVIILHMYPNCDQMIMVPDIWWMTDGWADRLTDGQMDGWKK